MSQHYRYERSLRRSAITLLINTGVLLIMTYLAHRFLPQDEAGRQLLGWINIVVPIVVIILLSIAGYFWYRNERFIISVDETTLKVVEPLFTSNSFSVPVQEIVVIKHAFNPQTKSYSIILKTSSGETQHLSPNYHYSRKKLYAALKSANPQITLPDHHMRFKQS